MADITQTAANVHVYDGAGINNGTAGATIAAGDLIYRDTDGTYKPAVNSTVTTANVAGMAITNATSGQPVYFATSGDVDPGGTVAVGEQYACSDNAGKFAPDADIGSGDYVTPVGIGKAADRIHLRIYASGIQHA